ncbi:MAG: RidA family protein [Bacteroidetes bacterium]|nr:RidA family protein [Bacteroidota bacterium]MCY4204845.1 RidA family protein [Bacteroidota bacterium]
MRIRNSSRTIQGALSTSSNTTWEARYGYSRAVRNGNHIFVSGTTAVTPDGNVVEPNNAYLQACYIFQIIDEALTELGASMTDVVRTRMYVVNIGDHQEVIGKAHAEAFQTICPAATMIEVSGLILPELLVEIEVDAMISTSP